MKRNAPTTRKPKGEECDNRPKGAQRLELVRGGLDQGKSQREIARELGWDQGTIRRDIAKLSLPPDKLQAIQKGDSAEKHLNRARFEKTGKDPIAERKKRKRLLAEEKRLLAEKETGVHSDALATIILDWLGPKNLTTHEESAVLKGVQEDKGRFPDRHGEPSRDPAKVLEHFERKYRPRNDCDMLERLNYYVSVLLSALPYIEPERDIYYGAVDKALREVRGGDIWEGEPRPGTTEMRRQGLDAIRRRRTRMQNRDS
jgi:transposase-like protein